MSQSRQLRRAAERAQRKQERKASKNSGTEQVIAAEPEISECELPDEELSEQIDTGAAAFHRLFSSETAVDAAPAPEPERTGCTGPRTHAGKAISCLNNLKHGLTGAFRVLEFESQSDFDAAQDALIEEHQPASATESELIRRMAEHAWLSRRAQLLQDSALMEGDEKRFSLYMRYQTTNDRGFRACLNDLFRLRREQRVAVREFESQNRATELHDARVRLANARAANLEIDTDVRGHIDAPIPGYSSVPVEQLKELFQTAMLSLQYRERGKMAA